MEDNNAPSKRRARGLSLRSQLLTKQLYQQSSSQLKTQPDIELGTLNEPPPAASTTPSSQAISGPLSSDSISIYSKLQESDIPDLHHGNNLKSSLSNSTNASSFVSTKLSSGSFISQSKYVKWLRKFKNKLAGVENLPSSSEGRKIPISISHKNFARHGKEISYSSRTQSLIDERREEPYCSNIITSSKYTIYSFLPKQLYAQFSKVANCYFLVVAIMQMIPYWSTTGTYTTIVPLLIFMSISMAREGYDDWRRHVNDKEENNKLITILKEDIDTATFDTQSIHTVISKMTDSISMAESDSESSTINEHLKESFANDKLLKKVNIKQSAIEWKSIKVGDIIKIQEDEWIPADILLLASTNESQEAFVETMALDGETNLKSRSPHTELSSHCFTASELMNFCEIVTVEDPNLDLYNFKGQLKINDKVHSLGPENVLYRGSVLRNTEAVIGVVIFTGEETKIRMNNIRNPRTKAPKLQKSINYIVLFMVLVVACLSGFSLMGERLLYKKYRSKNWYLFEEDMGVPATLMGFIIMYNTLIPLSLYVTMEVIKVMQLLLLQYDVDMYHVQSDTPLVAKTATILEELGQVSYIFSDKTGTLTDNVMIFRKFSTGGVSWLHDLDLISRQENKDLEDAPRKSSIGNVFELPKKKSLGSIVRKSLDLNRLPTNNGWVSEASPLAPQVSKNSLQLIKFIQTHPNTLFAKKVKFLFLSIALCNTCLPKRNPIDTYSSPNTVESNENNFEEDIKVTKDASSEDLESENEDDRIEYQASSPDELALVKAARDLGYVMFNRESKKLSIKTYANGFDNGYEIEEYEVLDVIEFSSSRKRMSVIVKFPDNRICLISKGADNVILERLQNSDLALNKAKEIALNSTDRKILEAELILKKSTAKLPMDLNLEPRTSISSISSAIRNSFTSNRKYERVSSFDNFIKNDDDLALQQIASNAKKSLHLQQSIKYNIDEPSSGHFKNETQNLKDIDNVSSIIPNENLLVNEEYIIEKTLEHIEEFSTEGLRTLLYSYKWLESQDYESWSEKYFEARSSLQDRTEKIEAIGEQIENGLHLIGATAIEDKLQDGVGDTIDKLRRAGIKLWMLTGDKRETAINIGHASRLIKDYSTIVILKHEEGKEQLMQRIVSSELEIEAGRVAHCVVVVDGATLTEIESDISVMSLFIELCIKSDSVICCRATPSQKASLVTAVRKSRKSEVTLAIGDGANDIAMIQSADIGIGITGKEGLQAARASDYSIAQFRYLIKLLLVHGRYNYVRTSKFVLCTFYKEFMFYLTQCIYQRQTLFTGSSFYESWSLSMFNTLFTSLPVLVIGMFDKDLKPATLIAVPELYSKGRLYQSFNLKIFISWMILATIQSLLVTFLSWELWGFSALSDNTVFPMGDLVFAVLIIIINFKCNLLEMQNRNWLAIASFIISVGGFGLWNIGIMLLYRIKSSAIFFVGFGLTETFGPDPTWWATVLLLSIIAILLDVLLQVFKFIFRPSDEKLFQLFEKDFEMRRFFEESSLRELGQGWQFFKEDSSFTRRWKSFSNKVGFHTDSDAGNNSDAVSTTSLAHDNIEIQDSAANRKRAGTISTPYELPPSGEGIATHISNGEKELDMLPSGKVRKREKRVSLITMAAKKLGKRIETDEEIDEIINQRLNNLSSGV